MLGLSWSELLVIGVVALIVIGPKDLPIMMRRIGEFVGQVRRMGGEFQRELQRAAAIDELKDIKKSVTDPLRQANTEITSQFNKMTPIGMQPTGVLAPRDPKTESVVDAIKTQAGMGAPTVGAPAATVADAAPAPVAKAVQVSEPAMTNPAFALSPARKVTPPPAPVVAAAPEPEVAPTDVVAKPKRVRKPKAAAEPDKAADAAAKPKRVRKPAAKIEAVAEAAPEAAKPARKPRARKAG